MDDDFDFELELLEDDRRLRAQLAAGDPSSRHMVYGWCEGAATEILRHLAHGHVTATAVTDGPSEVTDVSVGDWRYLVLDGDSVLVEFRADGTWTTRDGGPRRRPPGGSDLRPAHVRDAARDWRG